MSDRIVIQGPGSVAFRTEIHDFVKNKRQLTLYIRALQQLQTTPEEKDPSFFGVGGIHGLPYTIWNGAQGSFNPETNPDWTFGGYCTHGTVIFPTWHRPYVALYEELLHNLAVQIAGKFTVDQQAWVQEAQNFRQPYWDWATFASPPDEVTRNEQVTITDFNGKDVAVSNPLLRYTFQQNVPLQYFAGSGWENFKTTVRTPNASGKSNPDLMVRVLTQGHRKTTQDCIALLTRVHDWDGFSNHSSSENSFTNSLESIHDNIHNQVGGVTRPGHMSDPAVAGLDPIFFLHHCNVDRMITLWAAMNPGVWVSPGAGPAQGTFNIQPDTTVDTNTDLSPFWNSASAPTFWKSSAVVNTSVLGYNYADFVNVDMNNQQAVRNTVVNIIRGWMNPSQARSPLISLAAAPPSSEPPSVQAKSVPAPPSAQAKSAPAPQPRGVAAREVQVPHSQPHHSNPNMHQQQPLHSGSGSIPSWTVRVQVKHNELGRSFTVLVFLGPVPENAQEWTTAETLVGTEHAFVNSAARACANCTTQADKVTEGFIHINDFMAAKYPQLASFDPDVVKPFLQEHLSWRVIDVNGEPVELPSLQVTVFYVPMTWEEGADFPTAGDIHFHHDITHGKPGGYHHHH